MVSLLRAPAGAALLQSGLPALPAGPCFPPLHSFSSRQPGPPFHFSPFTLPDRDLQADVVWLRLHLPLTAPLPHLPPDLTASGPVPRHYACLPSLANSRLRFILQESNQTSPSSRSVTRSHSVLILCNHSTDCIW